MLDLIRPTVEYPSQEELRDMADEIQAGKIAMQRLAKELIQSQDSEVVGWQGLCGGSGSQQGSLWRQRKDEEAAVETGIHNGRLRGEKHEWGPANQHGGPAKWTRGPPHGKQPGNQTTGKFSQDCMVAWGQENDAERLQFDGKYCTVCHVSMIQEIEVSFQGNLSWACSEQVGLPCAEGKMLGKQGMTHGFFYTSTLIEMLGEFFLIYDEGRRCKYDENIFPHI